VRAVFAVGQPLRRAHADADRLRLIGGQRHAARRERDHGERRLLVGGRCLDVFQRPRRGHAAQFERNAIGRGFAADIVEDDFGAARAVQHDPGRRDEQIARCRGGRGGGERDSDQGCELGRHEAGSKVRNEEIATCLGPKRFLSG